MKTEQQIRDFLAETRIAHAATLREELKPSAVFGAIATMEWILDQAEDFRWEPPYLTEETK